MAGLAQRSTKNGSGAVPNVREGREAACEHAAYLFGLGYDRIAVSKAIVGMLYPKSDRPPAVRIRNARQVVRNWESKPWFRDMVWDRAVVQLDMSTPQILHGIKAKAKRGRVDAAKLALAVTGRYVEKTNDQPSAVTINLVGIPRPTESVAAIGRSDEIEGEVVGEEDG